MRSIYISIMIIFIAFTVNPVHAYKSKIENNKQAKISNKKHAHMLVAVSPKIDLMPSTTSVAVGVPFTLTGTFSLSVEPKRNIEALELDNPQILLFKKGVEPFNCTTFNWDKSDEDYANQSTKVTCVYKFATPGTYKVNIQYLGNDQYDPAKSNEVTVTVEKYPAPTFSNLQVTYPNSPSEEFFKNDIIKFQASYQIPAETAPVPQFTFQNCEKQSSLSQSGANTHSKLQKHSKSKISASDYFTITCVHKVNDQDVQAGSITLGIKGSGKNSDGTPSDYYNEAEAFTFSPKISVLPALSTKTTITGDIPTYLEIGQTITLNAKVSFPPIIPCIPKDIDKGCPDIPEGGSSYNQREASGLEPNDNDIKFNVTKPSSEIQQIQNNSQFKIESVGTYKFQAEFITPNSNKFDGSKSNVIERNVINFEPKHVVAVGSTQIIRERSNLENSNILLFEKKPSQPWQKVDEGALDSLRGWLNGVSCNATGSSCAAVGNGYINTSDNYGVNLLYVVNSKATNGWEQTASVYRKGSLEKVKCSEKDGKTACIAVGFYEVPEKCGDTTVPLIIVNENIDAPTSQWVQKNIDNKTDFPTCGALYDIDCAKDNAFCVATGVFQPYGSNYPSDSLPLVISSSAPTLIGAWNIYDPFINQVYQFAGTNKVKCDSYICAVGIDGEIPNSSGVLRAVSNSTPAWKWEYITFNNMTTGTKIDYRNIVRGIDCEGDICVLAVSRDSDSLILHTSIVQPLTKALYSVSENDKIRADLLKCFFEQKACIAVDLDNSNSNLNIYNFKYNNITSPVWSKISSVSGIKGELFDAYCYDLQKCIFVGTTGVLGDTEGKTLMLSNFESGVWQSVPIDMNGGFFGIYGTN